MENYQYILAVVIIIAIILVIYFILKSPFKYPYYDMTFDVSGKRAPDVYDLIDEHLNKCGFDEFSKHFERVEQWKATCLEKIDKSKLKKRRTRQFEKCVDDERMFRLKFIRKQTRYKQRNYVKTPYSVYITVSQYSFNMEMLRQRYDRLSAINFECTLSDYDSKDQRKRMTKALRDEIALRDNYTCQLCGKYMPDGVGLHIDHIVPIAKGGKSIPSNLQVLCSKCNGKKSSKTNI